MRVCVSINHMGLGDMFTMNGAIRYLSTIYDKVLVCCKNIYYNTVKNMFLDKSNIIVIIVKTNGCTIEKDDAIFKLLNDNVDFKITGINDIDSWSNRCGNLPFFERFYNQIYLDYNIRYEYEKINRNIEREIAFKEQCMKKYKEGYIFTHDHRGYIDHYDPRKSVIVCSNNNLPIFHPNINYYYNDNTSEYYYYWKNIISDNLLDYCKIIEDATEIHITDSSFCCLSVYLDLSKVKRKVLYSRMNKNDFDNYHIKLSDWEVIYN